MAAECRHHEIPDEPCAVPVDPFHAHAHIISAEKVYYEQLSMTESTNSRFELAATRAKCDLRHGKFVDGSLTGCKCDINYQRCPWCRLATSRR